MITQDSNSNEGGATNGARTVIDGIVHFDATDVRRTKMRASATRRSVAKPTATQPPSPAPEPAATPPQDVSPVDRPGAVSMEPMGNLVITPSPDGPLAPAARISKPPEDGSSQG